MTANTTIKTSNVKATIATTEIKEEKKINPFRLKDTFHNFVWTVVGLEECSWTQNSINLLKEHKETYKFIPLNEEWRRRLVVQYNTRQVPAIFKNNMYIGNYSALQAYYSGSFIDDSERFG